MDHQASVADEQQMAWAYVPQEMCEQENVHPVEEFVAEAPVEEAPIEAPVEEAPADMPPHDEVHYEDAPADAPVEDPNPNQE